MKKKIVGMIPVKLNNDRFPGKNIKRFFDGMPLITFVLKKLIHVAGIDELYVFCSNDTIRDYLIDGVTYLKRPTFLDTKDATPQNIMREFIACIDADIYMISHVTSPFVTVKHFEECINAVMSGGFDSSFTGEKIQKLLWTNNNMPLNFDAACVSRTQDLEPIYAENSAAYVFEKDVFLKQNRRVGNNPHITVISGIECIDIDYPEDFEIANAIYRNLIDSAKKELLL
jgi:CMP-N-acetylneuraminic acid synthetase